MKELVVLVALVLCGLVVGDSSPGESGMTLRGTVGGSDDLAPLEADPSAEDTATMRMSSVPDDDMHEEDAQTMASSQEDGLDVGGHGESMQLSGTAIKNTDDAADAEDESDVRVSEDMSSEASAVGAVFDAKTSELASVREQIEASKEATEQQMRDAKRLIKEAYSKQAYLNNLQKTLLQQSVSLEQQRHELAAKAEELDAKHNAMESQDAEKTKQAAQTAAQKSMTSAIQTQMRDLDEQKKAIDHKSAQGMNDLQKTKEHLERLKTEVDRKEADIEKKETDMKKLFVDLSGLKKASERHQASLREQEKSIKQQQSEIAAHDAELAKKEKMLREKEEELKAKEEMLRRGHHGHAAADRLAETQMALQTEMALGKPLSELPNGADIGPIDDTAPEEHIKEQAVNYTVPKPKLVVTNKPNKTEIIAVDRTSRSIETRMDQRPSTYGQKLLVGQAYSAAFQPKGDGEHADPDGRCRNSRGDIIPCAMYTDVDRSQLPQIVPTLSEYGDIDAWHGPCVLKCAYHKGVTNHSGTGAGPKNIEELSIEIPTDGPSNTYACPRTNNGFPFLHCSLLFDGSDKCESTCVFDGGANPLKPSMFGIGHPLNSRMNATDFRTFAHSTYEVATNSGCKSSMKADPLVACEVRV
jgi:hypothetical protein